MLSILTAIIPLFLLIGVGIVLQRSLPKPTPSSRLLCSIGLGSCETTTSVLNRFALYVALPALLISSLIHARGETIVDPASLTIAAAALLLLIAAILAVTHYKKIDTSLANTYLLCSLFGNVAYIGLPFLGAVYPGSEAGVSILIALHIAITFTIGVSVLEWSKHKRFEMRHLLHALLKNPLVLSVLLGVFLFIVPIPIPFILLQTVDLLAASASPVVLVAIGTFIATSWKPTGALTHSLFISAIKLIFVPLLTLLLGSKLLPSLSMDLAILEAAMPVALTNFALSELYPMRQKIIANAIILSTLLSLVTLSIWGTLLA